MLKVGQISDFAAWTLKKTWTLKKFQIFGKKNFFFRTTGSRRIKATRFEWTPLSETDFSKIFLSKWLPGLRKKSHSVRIMSTLSEEPHSTFDNSSTNQWKPLNFGVLVQNLI